MSLSVIVTNTWYQQCVSSCNSLKYLLEAKPKQQEDDITEPIIEIFEKNRKAYGTRKLKAKLHERGLIVSKRRIGRIMKAQGLASSYTVAQYKPHKAACNESQQSNEFNRQFHQSEAKRVVVSDLTYVRVKNRCTISVY